MCPAFAERPVLCARTRAIEQVAGLVDAIASNPQILGRLLAWLAIPQSPYKSDSLSGRSINILLPATYTNLQAILGLDHKAFACLYPHITLYSDRPEPDWRYASSHLIELLGLRSRSPGTHSVLNEDTFQSVVGTTLRVNVFPENALHGTAGLSVEVTITGKIDPSHLVRSWKRITKADASKQCYGLNTR